MRVEERGRVLHLYVEGRHTLYWLTFFYVVSLNSLGERSLVGEMDDYLQRPQHVVERQPELRFMCVEERGRVLHLHVEGRHTLFWLTFSYVFHVYNVSL